MGDAYRIATKVPWEPSPRDWSHKFNTVPGVLQELRSRAENHRGDQFDERVRGKEQFGNDRNLKLTIDAAEHDLNQGGFGNVIIVRAHKDNVEWWVRKIHDRDEIPNRPEANTHIDFLYHWMFAEHKSDYPGIECWGTCNRRFIDGTTIWSEHSPWLPGNPGCNAIDAHASYDVMYALSRDLPSLKAHVAKILFYGHEWTPSTGWISTPSVGHYDHVHTEGPRDHGGLASACNY